jgi:hypothetical protein
MREAHLSTIPTTIVVWRSRKSPQQEKGKMLKIRQTFTIVGQEWLFLAAFYGKKLRKMLSCSGA